PGRSRRSGAPSPSCGNGSATRRGAWPTTSARSPAWGSEAAPERGAEGASRRRIAGGAAGVHRRPIHGWGRVMGREPGGAMKKSVLAAAIAVVITIMTGLAISLPAQAHTSLRSSDPAKNAKVESLRRVTLEFTESVRFPTVIVRGPDGKRYERGK